MKKMTSAVMASVGASLLLGIQSAFAVDYTAAVTAATTEINSAITDALPLAALVLSAVVGWKLFKRFAKG